MDSSTDIHSGLVRSFARIDEVIGQTPGISSNGYIVTVFSEYRSVYEIHSRRTISWFGPFESRQQAEDLLRAQPKPDPTLSASPTSTQTVL